MALHQWMAWTYETGRRALTRVGRRRISNVDDVKRLVLENCVRTYSLRP